MELKLYNTLTKAKDVLRPIDPKNVRMYVCGPTVYDFAHIGNARPIIVFDVLFRLLRHVYGEEHVTYARNITDVEDKINARAAERGISIRDLTEVTYLDFREDVAALGTLRPTVEPRATEHIEEMRTIIERLIASGHAYVAEEHVLFSVPSMADYGKLSRRPLDDMLMGARIDVAPYKRNDMDFVLWKPSAEGVPGWPSPAGIVTHGRPGWHVECSAMAWKHLGETFDIHGGGIDLVFPHHENEIAQSRCAFNEGVMANVWMHNGFLQVEGEKMSKSIGNIVSIRELLTTKVFGDSDWDGSVLRLAMLQTHYRQPIGWTAKALDQMTATLEDWFRVAKADGGAPSADVIAALADDLNTPQMMAALHAIRKRITANGGAGAAAELGNTLAFLGFDAERFAAWLAAKRGAVRVDEASIAVLIASRTQARADKDWAESDRIRDQLAAMGVVLKDSKEGTTWEVAR